MNKRDKLYKEANEFFLAEKAKEEGIVALPSGVLYRKLEVGSGTVCPTPTSFVYVHYTGKLIDGTIIDRTKDEPLPA
jgi:peptidylprolyl isomerase